MDASRRKQIAVSLATLLSVFVPLWVYARRFGLFAAGALFNGDAFYYLTVAKRSSFRNGFTFDGVHQTNGFHPLWQWLLVAAAQVHLIDFSNLAAALLHVYLLNAVILSLAFAVLAWVFAGRFDLGWFALLTLCPGLFWIAALLIEPACFSAWAYCNGMESALALLCFGLTALVYPQTQSAPWRSVLLGVLLGLGTLARLDDGFVYAGIAVAAIVQAGRRGWFRAVLRLLPFPILVGSYLLYNVRHVGVLLPLSGTAKAEFALVENLKRTVQIFVPILYGDVPLAFRPGVLLNALNEVGGRELQLVLPAVICAAFLVVARRRPQIAREAWVRYACVGVLCKAAYTFVRVRTFEQGQWYFAVSIAIANLVVALTVIWWWRQIEMPQQQRRWIQRWSPVALVVWLLISCNSFFSTRDRRPAPLLTLPNRALNARVDALPTVGVLNYDDGLIAFELNKPAMGGIGLVLDHEATLAFHNGTLLDLAYRRGYRVIAANGFYGIFLQDGLERRSRGEDAPVFYLKPVEFRHYRIEPIAGDGTDDGVLLYRIVRTDVGTASKVLPGAEPGRT